MLPPLSPAKWKILLRDVPGDLAHWGAGQGAGLWEVRVGCTHLRHPGARSLGMFCPGADTGVLGWWPGTQPSETGLRVW